jgi:hypothetical protein
VTEASLNQQKIQELAAKLGGLDEVLTDEERSILIGILGTASNALAEADEDQDAVGAEAERMESRNLSEAFQLYFTPGHAGRFTVPPELRDVVARVIRG